MLLNSKQPKINYFKYKDHPIFLPEQRIIKLHTEPDCYGASSLISRLIRSPFTPRSFAYWLHGWNSLPIKHIEAFGLNYDGLYLVHRKEEEILLENNNKNAIAIGAPFTYTDLFNPAIHLQRIPNSLLIMPPHGMSYTTERWNESRYAEEIRSVIKNFDYTAVCISPNDIEKNSWVNTFSRMGIPIIEGARMNDSNALLRMRSLFNQFEFVTTNSMGSHVAYAAYAGAKVSFFGKYQSLDADSLRDDELFKKHPILLDFVVEHNSEKSVKDRFGFLFCHQPGQAGQAIDIANDWLGRDCMKSPFIVAKMLNWHPKDQIHHFSRKLVNKFKRHCGI